MAIFCVITTQALERNCATMEYLQKQIEEDAKRATKMAQIETFTNAYIANETNAQQRSAVITIPVVVHVIYNNNTENISDAQIQSQINVLNQDFRRTNSDANNVWSQAADTEIEFCLASVDPNGNATSGITRTSSTVSAFSTNDNMKFNSSGGKNAWPTGDYLNMWVCDISGTILGYAQFPGGAASTDGVVMDYQYFGTIGTATPPFNLGRTTTHEVGHWLNLRHIWGDGGCGVDDFVTDTPTSDAENYGCAIGHVSCNSTDMVQNYMDYSDDACMNLFTQGQKNRMQATLAGSRSSLLNSNGCGSTGPTPTCNDGIQNQGESGVDCGGPCAPCQCNGTLVNVSITLDNYPAETTWTISNNSGTTVASGGNYSVQGSTVNIPACLTNGCYTFTINDSYGDGICCGYGNGSYTVTGGGSTLASGGSFGSTESTNFCVGGNPPTCNDGIQNQGEAGVDCGGPCSPCASCNDGIQNQGETGVDCGGPCSPCTSCNDGIQNQGEAGVDCGGPCAPCATCNDGIQNQGETGVDCGGPCSPCGCNGTTVNVTITLDQYPSETTWSISNSSNGVVVASGGNYSGVGSTINIPNCLSNNCYIFTINDSYGDGICCNYGSGSYSVTGNGLILASGGDFGSSESTNFCLGGNAPTCNDGIQNQGETGVDCGGPCVPCNNGGCNEQFIDFNDFNSSIGIWNDGGADCGWYNSTRAYSAPACIRLQDNSNSSIITTDQLNLAGFEEVTIDFTYYAVSMESNEDFWLQVSLDNGAFFTVVEWNQGTQFNNNERKFEAVELVGTFSSNTKFRFRCDASDNNDYVYIDDIEITGCSGGARSGQTAITAVGVEAINTSNGVFLDLNLFPNPAQEEFNIEFSVKEEIEAQIIVSDINGKTIHSELASAKYGHQQFKVNSTNWAKGIYFVSLITNEQTTTKKLIIK